MQQLGSPLEGAPPGVPAGEGWRHLAGPGFPSGLGPLWARRFGDGWEYGLAISANHANATGTLHGGVLLALADHAMSLTAWEAAGRRPVATVQLSSQFLRPARPGDFLQIRSTVLRLSRNLVFLQASLTRHGGDLVATADGIWRTHEPAASTAASRLNPG